MGTRKKTLDERQPESQRAVSSGRAPSRRAPSAQPVMGLSSAVLQLPLRLTQPRLGLSSGAVGTIAPIEHAHPAATRGIISRLSDPPASKHPTVRQHFGELREALAQGFEIVQPIFARPLWTAPDDSATAFNFVLTRERTTRLVIVPEGRTIQRFIRERRLVVDYRR
jgi:hypothetical protein